MALSTLEISLVVTCGYLAYQVVFLIVILILVVKKRKSDPDYNIKSYDFVGVKLFSTYNPILIHMIDTSLSWGSSVFLFLQGDRSGTNPYEMGGYVIAAIFSYRILSGIDLWIVDYALHQPMSELQRQIICSKAGTGSLWQLLWQMLDINVFLELYKTYLEERPEVTIQFRDIRTMQALISSSVTCIVCLDYILEVGFTPDLSLLAVQAMVSLWSITSVLVKRDEVVFFEFRQEANEVNYIPHWLYILRRVWRFSEISCRLILLSMLWASARFWGYVMVTIVTFEGMISLILHWVHRRDKFVYEFIYALEFVFVHPNLGMEASDRWISGYYTIRFFEHFVILFCVWVVVDWNAGVDRVMFLAFWIAAFTTWFATRSGFFILRFYMSLPSFDKLIRSDRYPDEIEIQIRQHPQWLRLYHREKPMQIAIDASACNNFRWLKTLIGEKHASMQQFDWTNKNLQKWNLTSLSFANVNLFNTNLRYSICTRTKFLFARLNGCNFHRANLEHAVFRNASLKGSDMSMVLLACANLQGADFTNANLIRARMQGCNLKGTNFSRAKLHGADLSHLRLEDTNFTGANLYKANMERCTFKRTRLNFANCKNANLQHTAFLMMDDNYFGNAQFQGASLDDSPFFRADDKQRRRSRRGVSLTEKAKITRVDSVILEDDDDFAEKIMVDMRESNILSSAILEAKDENEMTSSSSSDEDEEPSRLFSDRIKSKYSGSRLLDDPSRKSLLGDRHHLHSKSSIQKIFSEDERTMSRVP